MASTFRRNTKGKGSVSSPLLAKNLQGTKPSTGGVTLTSSGLRDLDQILGSGQPLGACVLLEQDRWTKSLASTLVKYWCAQAISHGQDVLLMVSGHDSTAQETALSQESDWNETITTTKVGDDEESLSGSSSKEIEALLSHLPKNLNMEKEKKRKQAAGAAAAQASDSPSQPLEALREEEEDDDDDNQQDPDENLKIAWQYKKDVQRERQGGVDGDTSTDSKQLMEATNDTFCHSFDLQGRLSDQLDVMESCRIVDLEHVTNGLDYFQKLVSLLPLKHDKVTRLLIYDPQVLYLRAALPLLLSVIREKKLPIALLVVVKPWRQNVAALTSLHRTVDVVLQAEGFASRKVYPPPSEFRMFQGLLRIPKASTVTAATAHGGGHFADLTTTKRPASDLYGLKRDRRKLHIQLLHIPPEDYAEGGGSVGGGGVRSGAGRSEKTGLGCASSGGGGGGPLDF